MNGNRKEEIAKLTDYPPTVVFLSGLPEDRYQVIFPVMKLIKLLEYQNVSQSDIKAAEEVRMAYSMESAEKIALMAFIYGKIQGKKEERSKRRK